MDYRNSVCVDQVQLRKETNKLCMSCSEGEVIELDNAANVSAAFQLQSVPLQCSLATRTSVLTPASRTSTQVHDGRISS